MTEPSIENETTPDQLEIAVENSQAELPLIREPATKPTGPDTENTGTEQRRLRRTRQAPKWDSDRQNTERA